MATDSNLVSVAELARRLDEPAIRVIDCRFDLFDTARGRRDFLAGHVPGAIYAHLDDDLSGPVTADSGRHPLPDVAHLCATLRRLGVSRRSQVIAYDAGGGALAARLWWLLRWLGHRQVALLDGGFAAWLAAGLPVATGAVSVGPGDFDGSAAAGQLVTTAELMRRLDGDRALALVDARERARFEGREEPIDAAAGHIPGALNFPFAQNLTAAGTWRQPDDLRADWLRLFRDGVPEEWAVMCGSGVTACHLALSAARAGLPLPRLYAGSWSEWIRDPARPRVPG